MKQMNNKTTIKRYYLLAMLLLFCTTASVIKAQSKFHIVLDYHYNLGLNERYWNTTFNRSNYKMYGNSFHLTALYDIPKKMAVGIGIGADRYEEPEYNTFPIYGTFRYKPISKIPNGYIFTNLGYGIFKNESINPGWMWDVGIGYTKMFRKHFGLNFQLGYNLKEFSGIPSYKVNNETWETTYIGEKSSIRHSLSFGVGLVF